MADPEKAMSRFSGLQRPRVNSGYISTLPAPVKRRLKALKKIQLDSLKIEARFYEEVHKLECKYQNIYQPLHEKRSKIAMGEHEPNDDECQWPSDDEEDKDKKIKRSIKAILLDFGIKKETANKEALINDLKTKLVDEKNKKEAEHKVVKGVPKFWLTVFKNAFLARNESIEEADDPILTKLKDITVTFNESPMGFTLHFYFEPNDFFSNGVLTKEYEMKCEPNEDDPSSFEGPEIFNCKGCMINWKEPFLRKEVKKGSFFDKFFDPPPHPDLDDDADPQNHYLLGEHFAVGEQFRDWIIPKAVLIFTGEGLQEESDEEEEGEEEEEEDPPIFHYSSSE